SHPRLAYGTHHDRDSVTVWKTSMVWVKWISSRKRHFKDRPHPLSKAPPDVSSPDAFQPQTRSLQSFHSCSGALPGDMLPCEKVGRPISLGGASDMGMSTPSLPTAWPDNFAGGGGLGQKSGRGAPQS